MRSAHRSTVARAGDHAEEFEWSSRGARDDAGRRRFGYCANTTGLFFNGINSQLGTSLRSITFFLAAAMIIAGIIFIAYGIVTSGLRESLSTWKFITGAACFAFGGVCAAVYAFSQGETVPLDNQF